MSQEGNLHPVLFSDSACFKVCSCLGLSSSDVPSPYLRSVDAPLADLAGAVRSRKRSLGMRRKQRREQEEARLKQVQAFSENATGPLLQRRRLFAELTQDDGALWRCFPSACQKVCAAQTALQAAHKMEAKTDDRDATYNAYSRSWQQRHWGIRAAPKSTVKTPAKTQCSYGICMCRQGPGRDSVHPMWSRVGPWINKLDRELLHQNQLILVWQGHWIDGEVMEKQDPRSGLVGEQKITHVSYLNRKPLRCILWELEKHGNGEFKPATNNDGEPIVMTVFEWLAALDVDAAWDCAAFPLSTAATPVPTVAGQQNST